MAKSGLKHIDVGAELAKAEWESEESHEVVHGTSFPSSPVERQLFYLDDEHKWYIYDGSAWVWLGGGGGGGMQVHGNEYHDPDFATEAALSSHAAAATGVHGVGAGTIAKVGDIAVDSNLSSNAQDAIAKRHTQNTDKTLQDADADTKIQVEKSADEDKIRMDIAGIESFLLSANSILTLAKQSAAKATRETSQQDLPNGVWTKVQLNNEVFDIQGEFDPVTNCRFTAKEAGMYIVTGNAYIISIADGKNANVGIYVNGSRVAMASDYSSIAGAELCPFISTIVKLNANDYVELWAYQYTGSTQKIHYGSGLTGMAIAKIA